MDISRVRQTPSSAVKPLTGTAPQAAVPPGTAQVAPAQATRDRSQLSTLGRSQGQLSFVDDEAESLKKAGASASTQRKFAQLSATQQKQVVALLGINDTDLFALINNQKLLKKDHEGQTLLSHLYALKTENVKTGVRPTALISGALDILADRNKITQGPHGTCGAATLQQAMWKQDPAEMVRIVRNLAQKGQSDLRQGSHTLKADPNSFGWHKDMKVTGGGKETRNDFDILFQSAVMRSTALVGGTYGSGLGSKVATALTFGALGLAASSAAGSQSYNVRQDHGGPTAVLKGDSAAHPGKLSGLLANMTGNRYDIDVRDVTIMGMNWGTFEEMKTHTAAGKEPMAVFHAGEGQLHYVTMKSITDKQVSFYDTRGNGGVRTMSLADFKENFIFNITRE